MSGGEHHIAPVGLGAVTGLDDGSQGGGIHERDRAEIDPDHVVPVRTASPPRQGCGRSSRCRAHLSGPGRRSRVGPAARAGRVVRQRSGVARRTRSGMGRQHRERLSSDCRLGHQPHGERRADRGAASMAPPPRGRRDHPWLLTSRAAAKRSRVRKANVMLIPIVLGALLVFFVASYFVDRYRKRHRVDGWLSERTASTRATSRTRSWRPRVGSSSRVGDSPRSGTGSPRRRIGSVLALDHEVRAADGAGQLRLLPRELELTSSSSGISMPSESLNPTARFGLSPSIVYITLIERPLS